MALFLVQHGINLPKEKDPRKGLSEEGVADTERIAGVAAGYGVRVSTIVHSGKTRAEQTARIMAGHLKPVKGVQEMSGMGPLDDVAGFARGLDLQGNTMLVGHLPFLEKLAAYLITGKESITVFKMQNAGIVCLDFYPGSDRIVIKWALMPRIES